MKLINDALAENLHKVRTDRNYSLDELADLTGVSKSMLSQIERKTANPTVSTIWKICDGLKIPYTMLMSNRENTNSLIDIADVQVITSEDHLYKNVMFFPFDARRNFEIMSVTIAPGGKLESEGHPKGTEEYIIMMNGEMAVEHNGQSDIVRENQAMHFRAETPHTYFNIGNTEIRLVTVLAYQFY